MSVGSAGSETDPHRGAGPVDTSASTVVLSRAQQEHFVEVAAMVLAPVGSRAPKDWTFVRLGPPPEPSPENPAR